MSDNSRLAKNTILLYLRMLVQMAVSLYTSRVILKNLGIIDFGLYNVVGGLVIMFSFLNSAMNSSTQRYLTIALGRGNHDELKRVFNISQVIHALIGVIIVFLCEVFGLLFIEYKMVIPDGREIAVHWTFQLSMLSIFISTISIPYDAILIAREKIDVFAYFTLLNVIFQLLIAYLVAIVPFDRLIFFAFFGVIVGIFMRYLYNKYCQNHFPECKFKFYKSDPLYKEMTVFASWGLLGHFSCIINASIQNMMLNVFFSPVVNAARGVALKVSDAVMRFNENFQMAVSPQVTKLCARGEKEKMFTLIYNSSRFSVYLMWLLSLPVYICINDILHFWLVEVPDYTAVFLKLVLLDNLINSIANPLNMAIRANGKIKIPEIVGGTILCLNLPFAYLAFKMGSGPQSVFLIMIGFDVLCHCSRVYFMHLYLQMSVFIYVLKVLLYPAAIVLLSMIGPYYLYDNYATDNLLANIVLYGGISLLSVVVCVYFLGVNKSERSYLLTAVKNRIRR